MYYGHRGNPTLATRTYFYHFFYIWWVAKFPNASHTALTITSSIALIVCCAFYCTHFNGYMCEILHMLLSYFRFWLEGPIQQRRETTLYVNPYLKRGHLLAMILWHMLNTSRLVISIYSSRLHALACPQHASVEWNSLRECSIPII